MNTNPVRTLRLTSIAWLLIFSMTTSAFAQGQIINPNDISKPASEVKDGRNLAEPLNGYADKLTSQRHIVRTSNKPYAPIKPIDDKTLIPEVEMFVGETRVFPSPNIGRIAVGNGQIMSAAAIDDKEVIVFANAPGTSSLFIWNKDGRYQRIKLNIVAGDTSRIAREVAAFLTAIPYAKASIVGDKVIVEGDNLSDADILKIEQLEKRYPQIINFTNRVGWEQMVMMDVKVVEFPKTELRDIGLQWSGTGGATIGGIWQPIRYGNPPPRPDGYTVNIPPGASGFPIVKPDGTSNGVVLPSALNVIGALNLGLSARLNLLEQDGRASVLAEPQLSARNGAKASFLAGGEFPYSVSNINGVTIIFKPYGIKLDITPKVDRNGVIRATIEAEVSSIDASVTTTGGPALLTRRTNTEFNVRNGETIVLSGLIQRNSSTDIDKVPLLGDVPILGALFRSKRFQNKETELVVFVTPTVIDSHSPGLVERVERTTERLQRDLGKQPYLTDPLQPGRDMSRPRMKSAPPVPEKDEQKAENSSGSQPALTQQNSTSGSAPVIRPPVGESAQVLAVPASLPAAPLPTLRVKIDGLAVRQEAAISSQILLRLGQGSIVEALPIAMQASGQTRWTAVKIGEIKGWSSSRWLESTSAAPAAKAIQSEVARTEQSIGNSPAGTGVQSSITANDVTDRDLPRYHVNLDQLSLRVAPDVNAKAITQLPLGQIVEALPQAPRGYWTAVKIGEKTGWVATQWIERE